MFKEGQRVQWTYTAGIPAGTGTIHGLASPIRGGYIVKPDVPMKNWHYSHIVMFEWHLRPIPKVHPDYLAWKDWMDSVDRPRDLDQPISESEWIDLQKGFN